MFINKLTVSFVALLFLAAAAGLYIYRPVQEFSKDIDPQLEQVVAMLDGIKKTKNVDVIDLLDGKLKQQAEISPNERTVLEIMDQHNIKRVLYSDVVEPRAMFILSSFSLGAIWYYIYSPDGYTEEEQVSSIYETVKHTTNDVYHFCEKMNQNYWFLCTSRN